MPNNQIRTRHTPSALPRFSKGQRWSNTVPTVTPLAKRANQKASTKQAETKDMPNRVGNTEHKPDIQCRNQLCVMQQDTVEACHVGPCCNGSDFAKDSQSSSCHSSSNESSRSTHPLHTLERLPGNGNETQKSTNPAKHRLAIWQKGLPNIMTTTFLPAMDGLVSDTGSEATSSSRSHVHKREPGRQEYVTDEEEVDSGDEYSTSSK